MYILFSMLHKKSRTADTVYRPDVFIYHYCLLRIKGAAAFNSHNVRLDVQRLRDIQCFVNFHYYSTGRYKATGHLRKCYDNNSIVYSSIH